MNNTKFNKVEWINIVILKIFQDYFNLKELQDLSILSKHIRSKLKPILFKSIKLTVVQKILDDSSAGVFNSNPYIDLNNIENTEEDGIQWSLNLQNSLRDINSEIQNIKYFVNSLHIYNMKRSGQYLSQTITNFINLSVLNIHHSTVQYSIFQKLGEFFPMLEIFELHNVVLVKLPTDCTSSDETIFPPNLSNLAIKCVEFTNSGMLTEHCIDVLNGYKYYLRSEYTLTNIYIPSLKNLEFLRCAAENNGLEDFLETNPNLEHLYIDTFTPGMSRSFKSLKSLHLEEVYEFENLENLTPHHSIKTLIIDSEYEDSYEVFEKLCSMCPSVEFFKFIIGKISNNQHIFDDFLFPILKKLPNLKILELPFYIGDNSSELIDINHLPHIEKIIITTFNLSYLKINFEKNHNLKEIEFISNNYNINKEEFLEKYKSYTQWNFKFFDRKVKGYKI